MSDLYCLYHEEGTCYIYDASDLTYEAVSKDVITQYLKRGYKVNGVTYDALDLKCISYNLPNGVYMGDNYVFELTGVFRDTIILYKDDMVYSATFSYKYDSKVAKYRLALVCKNNVLYEEYFSADEDVSSVPVPLRDGVYLVINGSIKYKIDNIPVVSGVRYSTARKKREVLFNG